MGAGRGGGGKGPDEKSKFLRPSTEEEIPLCFLHRHSFDEPHDPVGFIHAFLRLRIPE